LFASFLLNRVLPRAALLAGLLAATSPAHADTAASADPLLNPSSAFAVPTHLMATRVAHAGGRLVSVGERGTILLSDDDGRSWRQVVAPVRVTLTSVFFPTPKHGYITGHSGVVLASEDGGEHWRKLFDGRSAAQLMLDDAKAAAAAEPTSEFRTARVREAQHLLQDGPDKPFLDVRFTDPQHGLIVGAYGLALKTEDGGASWRSLTGLVDAGAGRHLDAIAVAADGVYVVAEQGNIYKSTDGAASFVHLECDAKGSFFGAVVTPAGAVIAYGLHGSVWRSTDAGAHWQRLDMPPVSLSGGAVLPDGRVVLIDEDGGVWFSRDGGESFQSRAERAPPGLASLEPVGDGVAVLAGLAGVQRVSLDTPPSSSAPAAQNSAESHK
jgi:photosystem II stability/assembly factor-like uncharacterized protein